MALPTLPLPAVMSFTLRTHVHGRWLRMCACSVRASLKSREAAHHLPHDRAALLSAGAGWTDRTSGVAPVPTAPLVTSLEGPCCPALDPDTAAGGGGAATEGPPSANVTWVQ